MGCNAKPLGEHMMFIKIVVIIAIFAAIWAGVHKMMDGTTPEEVIDLVLLVLAIVTVATALT